MTKKEKKKKAFENYVEEERNEKAWLGFMDGYDAGYKDAEEKKESRCYRCGDTAILICEGCEEALGMKDAQNEWVDVNKRMPEEGVNVMAYTVSEFYEVLHYEDGYWIDLDFTMIKPIYVTHWQPLPKPPKKD